MGRLDLTDIPRVTRAPGEKLVIHPRTDKSSGTDISGDATQEALARWRANRAEKLVKSQRRWRLFGK